MICGESTKLFSEEIPNSFSSAPMTQEMNKLAKKVRLKERKINERGWGTAVLALFTPNCFLPILFKAESALVTRKPLRRFCLAQCQCLTNLKHICWETVHKVCYPHHTLTLQQGSNNEFSSLPGFCAKKIRAEFCCLWKTCPEPLWPTLVCSGTDSFSPVLCSSEVKITKSVKPTPLGLDQLFLHLAGLCKYGTCSEGTERVQNCTCSSGPPWGSCLDVSEISEMSKKSGSRAIWKFLLTDGSLCP